MNFVVSSTNSNHMPSRSCVKCKLPRKAWQVSPIRRQVVASHAVICGDFFTFSTTSLPGKHIFKGFPGRVARKTRHPTAIAAPTALRSEPTCPSCHSGICHGISECNSAGSVAASKRGRGSSEAHPRCWRHKKAPASCVRSGHALRWCWCQITKSECDAEQFMGKLVHASDDAVGLFLAWYGAVVEVVGELLLVDACQLFHTGQ